MEVVQFDGKKYVKASKAAEEVGYTADYVGQLCRAGKIDSRLVGRTWYVEEEALKEHKKTKSRSNKKKATESFTEKLRARDQDSESRSDEIRATRGRTPGYRKRLLDAHITYSTDDTEPIPHVKQGAVAVSESRARTPREEKAEKVPVRISDTTTAGTTFTATKRKEPSLKGALTVEEVIDTDDVVNKKPMKSGTSQKPAVFTESKKVKAPQNTDPTYTEEQNARTETTHHTRAIQSRGVRALVEVLPTTLAVVSIILFVMTVFLQSVWVYDPEAGERAFDSFFEIAAVYTVLEELEY